MGNYNVNSFDELKFFDAIRKYPGMYIGSKDEDGLHHLVKEVISNSIDEYLNRSKSDISNKIETTILSDGGIKIEDNGRGIPIGKKTGHTETVLQACFTKQHAGGKFRNGSEDSGYNSTGGMHGIGTKCVNALSDKVIIVDHSGDQEETLLYINGEEKEHKINKYSGPSGLSVTFYPSAKYLEVVEFKYDRIKTMFREFSFLCPGLQFTLIDERKDKKEVFYSDNGLYDYIEYLNNGKKDFLFEPFAFSKENGNFKVDAIVGYNSSFGSKVKLYTNNIPQEKGTHLTGFKTAWTSCLNQFAREKEWLKEKDDNLTGADYEEGQILILNFKMIDPVFKGQNKEELSSSEGRVVVQQLTTQALNEYFTLHEREIKIVVDKALKARNVREAAKKAREAARELNGDDDKKKKLKKIDSKLADCSSKNRMECELYITEGDSASGNLKTARDNKTQAVLPVRGKILNTQTASINEIRNNKEIMSMIQAFGLKVDPKTLKLTYDASTLRYGKIIIMSDADVDGAHIKNLFYTFIWNFCPDLIREGYIYAGVPPLYKVVEGNGKKYVYLKNDAELEEYRKNNNGKKYVVNRMKGLGEMNVDETEETLTSKENRNIKLVTVEDEAKADKLFVDLMGKNADAKKLFIKNYEGVDDNNEEY